MADQGTRGQPTHSESDLEESASCRRTKADSNFSPRNETSRIRLVDAVQHRSQREEYSKPAAIGVDTGS